MLQPGGQLDRFPPRLQGLLRDRQLTVECAEIDIRGGHLRDDRQADRALRPGLGQKLRPGGLRLPAVQSPKIRGPRTGNTEGAERQRAADGTPQRRRQGGAYARTSAANRRELLGAYDPHLRLLLQDVLRGDAKIEVVLKCRPDQFVQLLLRKNLLPALVAQGCVGTGCLGVVRPAEGRGSGSLRAAIVRPHGTPA